MSISTKGGQIIADWGRTHIGSGYIIGATGWKCTLKRRQQQAEKYAEKYPESAALALGAEGAQWDGEICYDCAQYTKFAVAAAGGKLPSGATSQWDDRTAWDERGTIDSLPDEAGIILYTRDKSNAARMSHTGIYIGNGETAEAQGTRTGCVRLPLSKGNWTHWGRHVVAAKHAEVKPSGDEMIREVVLYEAYVSTINSSLNLRKAPAAGSDRIGSIPRHHVVEVLDESNSGAWLKVRYGERAGWASAEFLTRVEAGVLVEEDKTVPINRGQLVMLRDMINDLLGEEMV